MHGINNGFESFAQRSEGIFYLGRDLRIYFSMDNSILFQFPQLLGKHFLGNASQGPMQLAETLDAVEQFPQDQDFPASAKYSDGGFHRTGHPRMRLGLSFHSTLLGSIPLLSAYFTVLLYMIYIKIGKNIAAGEIR